MENKIIEKQNLLERITSIILQKRKIFIIITILIIVSAFSLFFFNYYENIKNKEISEKYIEAGIYLTSNNKEKSKIIYKDIILSKNKLYSILALNSIVENNLEPNNSEVLKLFDIIEKIRITKNQKNLVKLKKALYLMKHSKSNEGEKLLKEIISSNSAWKKIALEASKQ